MAAVALSELVWNALEDVRSPAQRLADAEIDADCRDELDPLERLRQDAMALCSEYFARLARRNNQPEPECPGCQVRVLARRDAMATLMLRVIETRRRAEHRAAGQRLRVLIQERQLRLELPEAG